MPRLQLKPLSQISALQGQLQLRCDSSAPAVCALLLCSTMLLELEWIGYLALSALVVMCLVEWRVQASVEAGKKRDKPEKELRTKEELTAAASELGLDHND